jgi:hypothetical protein
MLDAKSLFSESYYQAEYPEVANAVARGGFSSGFDHFNKFGKFEGRDPSPFYDDSYYLSQYPGIAQAVRTGAISSGFDHFILYGQKEGRNSSTMFKSSYYLSNNPDVAAAVNKSRDTLTGNSLTAIEHFVRNGLDEGRASSVGFDVSEYLDSNGDLKAANLSNQAAAEHFALYGVDEGRRPNQGFDVGFYLRNNPDLTAAKLTNQQAFDHMVNFGKKEARRGTPGTPGIVAAGLYGGNIIMAVDYLSTTESSVVGVCNPGMSLANGTSQCPIFTQPSLEGTASTFFPNTGNPQQPVVPWTISNTDTSLTVVNNSNYAITRVVYGNAFATTQPNFLISDVANSSSDIFGSITYDPTNNTMTIDSAGKTGVLPGKSWSINRHFTVPEDLVGQPIKESAVLTFTPVK